MPKITQEKKAAKLKGKAAKTAAAQSAKKQKAEAEEATQSATSQLPNYGKCCTCSHYCRPQCSIKKAYTARKSTCDSYKH